jgi:phage terminase large subunit-like protein
MKKRRKSSYISDDPVKLSHSRANLNKGKGRSGREGLKPRLTKKDLKLLDVPGAKLPHEYGDDIIAFAEHHHFLKATRQPIKLVPWQRKVLKDIFYKKTRSKLSICGSVKKSGKSELAAVVANWFLCNVPLSESYVLAPDLDAGKDVVFHSLRTAILLHPLLGPMCHITKDTITFEYNDSFVKVLPNDLSVAGLRPNLTIIDEAWAFRTESSIQTLDEMTTNPCYDHLTLVTTGAGFAEDQKEDLHLWRWYTRGMAIKQGKEKRDPLFYFFWKTDYKGVPWVEGTRYLEHQRNILRLPTYQRFHENKWSSSVATFTTADVVDKCINPSLSHNSVPPKTRIVVGIDCGPKHDATALVALAKHPAKSRAALLVDDRIFDGTGQTIQFESTIERVMIQWANQYTIVNAYFDPYQMLRTAQVLRDKGIRMTEFAQTIHNMVSATTSLGELLDGGNLTMYPTKLRHHLLSASTKEHSEGVRLIKTQQRKKIDGAIALAMATEAAMKHFLLRSSRRGTVYTGE